MEGFGKRSRIERRFMQPPNSGHQPIDAMAANAAEANRVAVGVSSIPSPWEIVNRWCDPQWLPFMAFAFGPAALCLALGEWQKAKFFGGAAIYLGVLKWLGWVVLGRRRFSADRYLLFPAEIFCGLAVACAWFYARNLVGWLWPASYSLRELAWLGPLAGAIHVASELARVQTRRRSRPEPIFWLGILHRAAMYVPFWFILTVALWEISGSLNVQATDAITHAFQARAYAQKGMFFSHFNGNRPFNYPSSFASINAITASIAPLTVVQAVNLQHVLLLVLALFLITGGIAELARQPLPCVQSLPLAFLSFFPLYALYPDYFYEALARQTAPALLTAICVVPFVAPVADVRSFYRLLAVVAMLSVLALVINPACFPFATLGGLVALYVFCRRGKRDLGQSAYRVTGALALFTALALGLVLACDGYYRGLLTNRGLSSVVFITPPQPSPTRGERGRAASPERGKMVETASPKAGEGVTKTAESTGQRIFSFEEAIRLAGSVRPLQVGPPSWDGQAAETSGPRDWSNQKACHVLPWVALLLAIVAWAVTGVGRGSKAPRSRPLLRMVFVCVVIWLALQYGVAFVVGGIAPSTSRSSILRGYIVYLSVRCQLLVAFTAFLAATVALYLQLLAAARRMPSLEGGVGAAVPLILFAGSGPLDDDSWLQWLPSVDYRSLQEVELILLLLVLGCGLFVIYETAAGVRRGSSLRNPLPVACAVLLYLCPFAIVLFNPTPGGMLTLRPHPHGDEAITSEDLRLVSWVDSNITPENGLIGLSPLPFEGPFGREERYMHPFGAAQALLLYGKEYNLCFCQQDPSRPHGYGDYVQHVQFAFDADWCLENNIRYFYVSHAGIRASPGLGRAIEQGHLKLLRQGGACGVYEAVR
jgi:hypothetical protein